MDNPYASLYGSKVQQLNCGSSAVAPSSTEQAHLPWHQPDMASNHGSSAVQPALMPALVDPEAASASVRAQQAPWHEPCARSAGHASTRAAAPHAQQPEPSRKRRRFAEDASSAAVEPQDTVLVWDLDETLVLFHSLHDGRFSAAFGMQARSHDMRMPYAASAVQAHIFAVAPQDSVQAQELGRQWQDALMDLGDSHFFFEQVDVHLRSWTRIWMQHEQAATCSSSCRSRTWTRPASTAWRRRMTGQIW